MSRSADISSVEAWDQYWSAERIAACSGDAGTVYYAQIEQEWQRYFSQLPESSLIVDLCTGNGAIALLAQVFSDAKQCDFQVHGVDRSRINPSTNNPAYTDALNRVRFHSATLSDALPFKDAEVDAVTCQYALEYTPLESTLSELARVLKPGGRLQAIMHSDDSAIMQQTRIDLQDGASVLHQTKILDKFKALLEADHRRLTQHEFTRLRSRFDQAAARLINIIQQRPQQHNQFLNQFLNSLGEVHKQRQSYSLQELANVVEDMRRETLAHQRRLLDMQDAALDQSGLQSLLGLFETAGFASLEQGEVVDEHGFKLGCKLQAVMPA